MRQIYNRRTNGGTNSMSPTLTSRPDANPHCAANANPSPRPDPVNPSNPEIPSKTPDAFHHPPRRNVSFPHSSLLSVECLLGRSLKWRRLPISLSQTQPTPPSLAPSGERARVRGQRHPLQHRRCCSHSPTVVFGYSAAPKTTLGNQNRNLQLRRSWSPLRRSWTPIPPESAKNLPHSSLLSVECLLGRSLTWRRLPISLPQTNPTPPSLAPSGERARVRGATPPPSTSKMLQPQPNVVFGFSAAPKTTLGNQNKNLQLRRSWSPLRRSWTGQLAMKNPCLNPLQRSIPVSRSVSREPKKCHL
jgi:hypothetical protein